MTRGDRWPCRDRCGKHGREAREAHGDIIPPMLEHAYRAAALFALLLLPAACSPPPDPITIAENGIVVKNATSRDWKNVRVTVNDHFSGGVPLLAAGGRMNAPLSQFQTGFGQRYDPARQVVYKVEVTATDSRGEAVNLRWGRDRNR
jgi:hypothetical protein